MTDYLQSQTLIVQMVDRMMMNQELQWTKDHKNNMPPQLFRREFQTVKIHLPRRSGHTTAAWFLYYAYPSIMIYPQYDMLQHAATTDFLVRDPELHKHIRQGDFVKSLCHIPHSQAPHKTFSMNLQKLVDAGVEPELLIFDVASRINCSSERPEDTIEIMTSMAFEKLPSMKGVVVLQ